MNATYAPPRWGASLGIVLAAHALAIGTATWWHGRSAHLPLPAPAEAVMVELAPLPEAPPATPTELPPGPPQQEQRKAQPKAEPEPAPEPEPRPVQPDAEVALPRQPQERQNEESADIDVARTTAPPSVASSASHRYAASQSLSGAPGQAEATWQSQLLGHLERHKQYPRSAERRRQEGTVQVQFSIDRQGQLVDARIVRSSGHEALDAEALATLKRANPLPPPPDEIHGDPVKVTTPVNFSLRRR